MCVITSYKRLNYNIVDIVQLKCCSIHTVPCKKTRDFGNFPYKPAIFE